MQNKNNYNNLHALQFVLRMRKLTTHLLRRRVIQLFLVKLIFVLFCEILHSNVLQYFPILDENY